MPEPGETIHIILSGLWRTWDLVPVCLGLAKCVADEVILTTLGYDRKTIDGVLSLLDSGAVRRFDFVTSAMFDAQNKSLADEFRTEMANRGQRVIGIRNHTKIMLLGLADGRRFVIESSGNLRSCHSMEQSAITCDAGLYAFHSQWIGECFTATDRHKNRIIR